MDFPNPKLKPCPCCKGESALRIGVCKGTRLHLVFVECTICRVKTGDVAHGYSEKATRDAALKEVCGVWNRRDQ